MLQRLIKFFDGGFVLFDFLDEDRMAYIAAKVVELMSDYNISSVHAEEIASQYWELNMLSELYCSFEVPDTDYLYELLNLISRIKEFMPLDVEKYVLLESAQMLLG